MREEKYEPHLGRVINGLLLLCVAVVVGWFGMLILFVSYEAITTYPVETLIVVACTPTIYLAGLLTEYMGWGL